MRALWCLHHHSTGSLRVAIATRPSRGTAGLGASTKHGNRCAPRVPLRQFHTEQRCSSMSVATTPTNPAQHHPTPPNDDTCPAGATPVAAGLHQWLQLRPSTHVIPTAGVQLDRCSAVQISWLLGADGQLPTRTTHREATHEEAPREGSWGSHHSPTPQKGLKRVVSELQHRSVTPLAAPYERLRPSA